MSRSKIVTVRCLSMAAIQKHSDTGGYYVLVSRSSCFWSRSSSSDSRRSRSSSSLHHSEYLAKITGWPSSRVNRNAAKKTPPNKKVLQKMQAIWNLQRGGCVYCTRRIIMGEQQQQASGPRGKIDTPATMHGEAETKTAHGWMTNRSRPNDVAHVQLGAVLVHCKERTV